MARLVGSMTGIVRQIKVSKANRKIIRNVIRRFEYESLETSVVLVSNLSGYV